MRGGPQHIGTTGATDGDFLGYDSITDEAKWMPSPGVPPGGAVDQVLTKASATDYDTVWSTPGGGGGGASWDHPLTLPLSTLTGWTAGAGTWSITSSVIRQALTTNNVFRLRYSAARLPLAEMVVEADIRIDVAPNTVSSRAGFVFGAPWGSDGTAGLLCALIVNTSGFVTGVNWEYDAITAGPTVALAANIALGTWITLRCHKVGSEVAAYVNGTFVGTGHIDQPNREQGALTLYSYAADASYRNLDVWTPTLP